MDTPCSANQANLTLGEARFSPAEPGRSPVERRATPRYAVELEVTVSSEHNFYDGLVRNMGVAGVFIATHTRHTVGDLIDLTIKLPGMDEPIKALGEVRWMREYTEHGPEPGIGVRFSAISESAVSAIERFLRCREPLLYEE